ncbi:MAG TPA: molybdenum cofactor biosynthesis protein MoaE [Gaiellales bacterium]|nr:molybdenum cofactor biosynthesis protein MoaE [Gaiellales bacterium]
MRVTVRLFAALRERAGAGQREVELPQGATAGDVFAALGIGAEPPGLAYAVNQEYAERSALLTDGDEVAVIPPVSGGESEPLVLLGPGPIDLARLIKHVSGPDAGAIATFTGTVRATARDRDVLDLEYEAYPGMAEREIARIARAAVADHGCLRSAVWHRTGVVAVGEASVAIAISSAHRAAAFAACKQAIDTLKVTVPIWKKERYADGEIWVGQGS